MYKLIPLLLKEADLCRISVSASGLDRETNYRYRHLDEELNDLWGQLKSKEISTARFFKNVARLYGPTDN